MNILAGAQTIHDESGVIDEDDADYPSSFDVFGSYLSTIKSEKMRKHQPNGSFHPFFTTILLQVTKHPQSVSSQ